MKQLNRAAIAFLAALSLSCQGCCTLFSLGNPRPGDSLIYIGARTDIRIIGEGGGGCCSGSSLILLPLFILDLPLSFLLDTVLLPITLTYELCRPAPPPPAKEEK